MWKQKVAKISNADRRVSLNRVKGLPQNLGTIYYNIYQMHNYVHLLYINICQIYVIPHLKFFFQEFYSSYCKCDQLHTVIS